jgi:hypothetical protein
MMCIFFYAIFITVVGVGHDLDVTCRDSNTEFCAKRLNKKVKVVSPDPLERSKNEKSDKVILAESEINSKA